MNKENKLDVERLNILNTERVELNNYEMVTKGEKYTQPKVIFYCPFNHTFTKIKNYDNKEILGIINSHKKDDFFIIQIDNDSYLYEELIKMQFKSDFENIDKLFDLKLDYCFSPVDELLCFNLSVVTNIDLDEIQKYLIQIFFCDNGVYIINKDCCDNILNIFITKFQFREVSKHEFFGEDNKINRENFLINSMSIAEKQLKSNKLKSRSKLYQVEFSDKLSFKEIKKHEPEFYFIKEQDTKSSKVNNASNNKNFNSNFSTDDLIYYLLTFSLGKLEEFADSLIKEAESLKGIYLELSEKERKDFFRRIHNMEISLQLIFQETLIKKKFLKYSKKQFKVYNQLSHNFYFKNTFNFFIELIISKVTQLEIIFEKLENTIKMIKENYSIIIEDNTEKQNIKLNNVMKVLAIITTIYAPLNIIPNIFGMNVKVPWQATESLWPFFGIISVSIFLVFVELIIFKRLKWLED